METKQIRVSEKTWNKLWDLKRKYKKSTLNQIIDGLLNVKKRYKLDTELKMILQEQK